MYPNLIISLYNAILLHQSNPLASSFLYFCCIFGVIVCMFLYLFVFFVFFCGFAVFFELFVFC